MAKFVVSTGNHGEFGNADFMPDKTSSFLCRMFRFFFINQTQEKYLHMELKLKSFCMMDFISLKSLICFMMTFFLAEKHYL